MPPAAPPGPGPVRRDRVRPTVPATTSGTAASAGPQPQRRPRWAAPWDGIDGLRAVLWLVCGAVILLPLSAIVVLAITNNHLPLLLSGDVVEAARNSVVSAATSAVGAVLVGTILALLLDRSDLRGRRTLRLLALTPLLVPPFVGAIAWIGIAGPTGPVNRAWTEWFGGPLWIIYGGDGVVFLLIVHSYPIAYIIMSAALRRVPSDLEQAARISGASLLRSVTGITLPLLRPAAFSAFTLIAVSNLADFGIPSIIGLPERFVTLSTLVYRYIQSGTVESPLEVVATIGVVLLGVAVLSMVIDLLVNRTRVELDQSSAPPQPIRLGRARAATSIVAWTLVLAITLLPLLALTSQALLPAPGVPLAWENLTLDNIVRATTAPGTIVGATNSVMLSVLAGLICTVLGLAVGTIVTRTRARSNAALATVALLPQAIPGLVIAVGWLIIAPRIGLFNTPWLILCAYVMAFVAVVVQAVAAPLRSTPMSMEEAARISGASRLRALIDISWRMAVPAAVAGGVLVALTAVRELTISVLLLSPGSQTLGVSIFSLQQAGAYNAAAALSLLVTLVGLAGLGLVDRRRH
ncbi:iron ABC transporter permease [Cryobacterium melibiosiphilum]|uniref:Iron ABC transporter permease n=1 Tax=Cryobacterium melibiosiphilum TaxID=995039 RepID=A0A3A5MNY4_9MICO|nr:iron ABC transporter permease [Cryobacterium melibiosiphilum]RJT89405.1 iron ABC transporter permease [Cryobacterium melibiosiphilum]